MNRKRFFAGLVRQRRMAFLLLACVAVVAGGCDPPDAPLGTADNPIRIYFTPSQEVSKIITEAKELGDAIEDRIGKEVKVIVPPKYDAIVQDLKAGRGQVAFLTPFGYVMSQQMADVEAALTVLRFGEDHYRGQILVRADSGIETIEDLEGKSVAFTDALSTSGYLYPSALLKSSGVKPANSVFAGGHVQAALALYNGNVDAACCFWSPPEPDGAIGDARKLLADQFPDVTEKLVILTKTEAIPNDTVSFSKSCPDELREEIIAALVAYSQTEEGQTTLDELYGITGFVPAKEEMYDSVRGVLRAAGMTAEEYTAQQQKKAAEEAAEQAVEAGDDDSREEDAEDEPGEASDEASGDG